MTDLIRVTLKNRYFIKELIGRGATADVYLAWDQKRQYELAVKVLHQDLAVDEHFQQMLKKEADYLSKLQHPNIIRLYEFGEDKTVGKVKTVFFVMDYKEGRNLRAVLDERKSPLEIKEVSQILAAVCKALHYAHQEKVFHCDIKPANILIAKGERTEILDKDVFLADFGVAHLALQDRGGGTPAYMAPELFLGAKVNEQVDIYALGVTLYELLSGGQLPFRGETNSPGKTTRDRMAWEKVNKPLPSLRQFNPNLNYAVVAVVEKLLNRDPKSRYSSTLEVWNSFEKACNSKLQEGDLVLDQPTIIQPSPVAVKQDVQRISTPPVGVIGPHLVGISGEKSGQVFSVSQKNITIGRHISNDLRLEDRTVSRYHAVIIFSNQSYYIQDQGSGLGTFLNGMRVSKDSPRLLKNGDHIRISNNHTFEFHFSANAKGHT